MRYKAWGLKGGQRLKFLVECQKKLLSTGCGSLGDRVELRSATRSVVMARDKAGEVFDNCWSLCAKDRRGRVSRLEACEVEVYMILAWAGRMGARGEQWSLMVSAPWSGAPVGVPVPNWCPDVPSVE